MTEALKQNYKKGIKIIEGIFTNPEYTQIISDAKKEFMPFVQMGDVAKASEVHSMQIKSNLIPYLNTIELPKEEVPSFDVLDVSDEEYSNTMFGMKPLDETMYHIPVEEVKESMDNVLTKENVEDTNTDIYNTTIIDFGNKLTDEVEEVEEIEEPKTLTKKKAGYIDTVILCLVAQLGIFALLIVVLLIIK